MGGKIHPPSIFKCHVPSADNREQNAVSAGGTTLGLREKNVSVSYSRTQESRVEKASSSGWLKRRSQRAH